MTLVDIAIVYACSFSSVFLLGFQSKNVNQSKYLAAIVTSFLISVSQAMFIKYMSVGSMQIFWVAAFGGCCGIAASIYMYDKIFKKPHANN